MVSKMGAKISALLLVLGGFSLIIGQTVPKAKERVERINGKDVLLKSKMKSLLQLNFTFGYHHNAGKPVIDETLKRISKAEGWEIQTLTDQNQVNYSEISKYTAICANNISGWNQNGYPLNGRTAIEKYVEQDGRGVMGIHASGDGKGGAWPWFNDYFHPVGYDDHASRVNAPAILADQASEHPIMEGILTEGERITFAEFYQNRIHITENNPNAELLLKTDPNRCSGCYEPQHIHPEGNHIMWALPVGSGYHLFFPYGHDQREMDEFGPAQEWDKLFTQIFYYIAGYDSLTIGCMDQNFIEFEFEAEIEYPQKGDVCLNLKIDPVLFIDSKKNFEFGIKPEVNFFASIKYQIRLRDVSGNLIEEINRVGPGNYQPNLDGIESGLYFFQVKNSMGLTKTRRYFIHSPK